eukprot:5020508-Prymnesium_polylepis.1
MLPRRPVPCFAIIAPAPAHTLRAQPPSRPLHDTIAPARRPGFGPRPQPVGRPRAAPPRGFSKSGPPRAPQWRLARWRPLPRAPICEPHVGRVRDGRG